jgi:hypothetical protein
MATSRRQPRQAGVSQMSAKSTRAVPSDPRSTRQRSIGHRLNSVTAQGEGGSSPARNGGRAPISRAIRSRLRGISVSTTRSGCSAAIVCPRASASVPAPCMLSSRMRRLRVPAAWADAPLPK